MPEVKLILLFTCGFIVLSVAGLTAPSVWVSLFATAPTTNSASPRWPRAFTPPVTPSAAFRHDFPPHNTQSIARSRPMIGQQPFVAHVKPHDVHASHHATRSDGGRPQRLGWLAGLGLILLGLCYPTRWAHPHSHETTLLNWEEHRLPLAVATMSGEALHGGSYTSSSTQATPAPYTSSGGVT